MADITLCVDVGGSLTKVIYQLSSGSQIDYLLIPPYIEEINQSELDGYRKNLGWAGEPHPKKKLWVCWNKRVVTLGDFATNFDKQDRLKELKYENALWKVLGIIGLILETNKINIPKNRTLKIDLAILLPRNEYSDRSRFQEQLTTMLAKFSVRNTTIKAKLNKYLCRPEGGGLAALQITCAGIPWLQKQQLGILMFGHRNVTALYFDEGELKLGDSPLLGFSLMLDMVIEAKSGLTREKLASSIYDARLCSLKYIYGSNDWGNARTLHPKWSDCHAITSLATASDPNLRASEIGSIANSIHDATVRYWHKLERWLDRTFLSALDTVVIGGGAAYHIQPELEDYFNCEPKIEKESYTTRLNRTEEYKPRDYDYHFTPIIWGSGQSEHVSKVLNLNSEQAERECLSARLIDCFGLFNYLAGKKNK